jgi:hypothetical protein
MNNVDINKVVDVQNSIIKLQSEVITELFHLLSMYIVADELDNLPAVSKINLAAALRSEISHSKGNGERNWST